MNTIYILEAHDPYYGLRKNLKISTNKEDLIKYKNDYLKNNKNDITSYDEEDLKIKEYKLN